MKSDNIAFDTINIHDRLKGMLWGLVVGDCLGSPVQFTGKDDHPYITEMVPCAHFNTPAGYWTDDASMAFCIMESFVRCGKYDLADIGCNFVKWYLTGFWSSLPYAFDVGNATSAAMLGIERGQLVNGEENSQGNGSIMRFAPSYIMNLKNNNDNMLFEISDLTHRSEAVRKVVSRMRGVCDQHIAGERTTISSQYNTREEVNNSGWAVSTLDAALWAFHSTETFEDGLIAAVNLGGDADTIGAVYGQIAGLYYGCNAIPERWLSAVKDREKIDALIERFLQTITVESGMVPPDCGQKCPLAETAKINYFARKWYWKFADRYPDVGEWKFAEECFGLGFGMDSGKWFVGSFPDHNVQDPAGLREIIRTVDDIFFLGTAIFSYWRYQTHWADWYGMEIYSDETREWMMIAFERLIELTTEYRIILSDNDGSGNCVIAASPNRVLICRENKRCYGPVSAESFFNTMDRFGCHYYAEHIPSAGDEQIIRNALAAGSDPVLPIHALPVEEEFWGRSDAERRQFTFMERCDGSVVPVNKQTEKISVAGVFAIPDRKKVLKEIREGQKIILVREPENEHDSNAIRVETFFPKHRIGYIPRKLAAILAVELDRGFDHVGTITELDVKSGSIAIDLSRRETVPLDGVTSITLREFSGSPVKPEWEYRTTVNFLQKKFIRRTVSLPPKNKTAVFELKFSDEAWRDFVLKALHRCNILAWTDEQYDEVVYDIFGWELIVRFGKKRKTLKLSGGRPMPMEWERFQSFIRECQDVNTMKGSGKFYIKTLRSEDAREPSDNHNASRAAYHF